MKKIGLLFVEAFEVYGVYCEIFQNLETREFHFTSGLTSISGK